MVNLSRRGFLIGAAAGLAVAPAIVRIENLMPLNFRLGVARFRLVSACQLPLSVNADLIDCTNNALTVLPVGTEILWDGSPNWHMKPLNESAERAVRKMIAVSGMPVALAFNQATPAMTWAERNKRPLGLYRKDVS